MSHIPGVCVFLNLPGVSMGHAPFFLGYRSAPVEIKLLNWQRTDVCLNGTTFVHAPDQPKWYKVNKDSLGGGFGYQPLQLGWYTMIYCIMICLWVETTNQSPSSSCSPMYPLGLGHLNIGPYFESSRRWRDLVAFADWCCFLWHVRGECRMMSSHVQYLIRSCWVLRRSCHQQPVTA